MGYSDQRGILRYVGVASDGTTGKRLSGRIFIHLDPDRAGLWNIGKLGVLCEPSADRFRIL